MEAGTISQLWRYPVKSMLGERREMLRINARGVEGDRLYAIRESSGKLGSGKDTRRFRHVRGLLEFQASYYAEAPSVRLPNGRVVESCDPAIHDALSAALKQSVTLVRESEVMHMDAAPVHLLTSVSLAWLRSALPNARVDARRFRPNLVIELPGAHTMEQEWIGRRLRVGSEVELVVTLPTERCGMLAFAQGELPQVPGILRHITRRADLKFGVYATIAAAGVVRLNDPVRLI